MIVASLLGLTYFGFETLSSARAYVGGEGFWSKAQRHAVYHLMRYARNSDPAEYALFRSAWTVPLGDREARLQSEGPDPDPWRVKVGFLLGRNHPQDIERMATFYRRFRNVSFVDHAVGIWTQADSLIGEPASVGSQVNAEITSGRPDPVRLESLLTDVDTLSGEANPAGRRFLENHGRWRAMGCAGRVRSDRHRRGPPGGACSLRDLAHEPAGAGVGGALCGPARPSSGRRRRWRLWVS